jgi:tetratricopeptide (TPR) repeat protein
MIAASTFSDAEGSVETLYATGHWLLSAARTRDALKVFQCLTLIAPSDERGWLALGSCHEALDQDSVALELYALGARAAAPSARCLLARAQLLRRTGDTREADECMRAAAEAYRDAPDPELARYIHQERDHG